MEKISLKLEDAPLLVGALYPNAEVTTTWLRQTSYAMPKLPKKLSETYSEKMDWIMRQYHALQKQDDLRSIAPHVLPYAAKVALEIQASRAELAASTQKLQNIPTDYTRQLAKSLTDGLDVSIEPNEVDAADDIGGSLARDRKRVRLVEYQPLNEFELITPARYEQTSLSWHDAAENSQQLNYEHKQRQLESILASGTGLSWLLYRFEIVTEPQVMRELQERLTPNDIRTQLPTPAHGYNVPKVNDGGMIERCFDISYELYSSLQTAHPEAAPLVCLYGHRQRYLAEFNGSTIHKLYDRRLKLSPPALNILKFIRKEIALRHQTIHTWFDDKEKVGRKMKGDE